MYLFQNMFLDINMMNIRKFSNEGGGIPRKRKFELQPIHITAKLKIFRLLLPITNNFRIYTNPLSLLLSKEWWTNRRTDTENNLGPIEYN
jgi:hypothetical protein